MGRLPVLQTWYLTSVTQSDLFGFLYHYPSLVEESWWVLLDSDISQWRRYEKWDGLVWLKRNNKTRLGQVKRVNGNGMSCLHWSTAINAHAQDLFIAKQFLWTAHAQTFLIINHFFEVLYFFTVFIKKSSTALKLRSLYLRTRYQRKVDEKCPWIFQKSLEKSDFIIIYIHTFTVISWYENQAHCIWNRYHVNRHNSVEP